MAGGLFQIILDNDALIRQREYSIWACFPEATDRECRVDVVYAKCFSEKRLARPRSLARRIEAQRPCHESVPETADRIAR